MKREIQYCFSVFFLFIGHSSIFHQRGIGNEKNIVTIEKQYLFFLAEIFFSLPKLMMKGR